MAFVIQNGFKYKSVSSTEDPDKFNIMSFCTLKFNEYVQVANFYVSSDNDLKKVAKLLNAREYKQASAKLIAILCQNPNFQFVVKNDQLSALQEKVNTFKDKKPFDERVKMIGKLQEKVKSMNSVWKFIVRLFCSTLRINYKEQRLEKAISDFENDLREICEWRPTTQ